MMLSIWIIRRLRDGIVCQITSNREHSIKFDMLDMSYSMFIKVEKNSEKNKIGLVGNFSFIDNENLAFE